MLTKRQKELLIFIHGYLKENGYSPSYQEMQESLDLSSKSGIARHVQCLVERGFVRRIPNKARALEVIKLPSAATISAPPKGRQEFRPTIVGVPRYEPVVETTIPVVGSVGINSPKSIMNREMYRIRLPHGLDEDEDYFVLEMNGDWMHKAGILDEDILIFKRTDIVSNGNIVCATVDNEAVSVRRYRQSGKSIALETVEDVPETQIFKRKQVELQGKMVLLQRRY